MRLLNCPPEILEQIVSHIPQWYKYSTCGSLSLTCSSLRGVGQKHVFQNVSVKMNIPTPYHSENGDGNMEPKLPSPFLRLHQVLEKNPTLASYISELCIFTHMQGSTFWMTENASEVAVALWMDILTLIDNHSLFICAFRMSASSPTYWSQINQNIRSMILKIWCKPTMKRIYLNNIRDLPRDLCGLKGACAGRLELHNFSFGSDGGEEDEDESFRDNRKPAGEDQVVVKNDGSPGIAELSVNLGSKEQLDSFLSAITYPSDATGLRGIRSLDLVFGLEDDLPATVSAVMLPMFLSLERLSLQWKKDTMRRSNGKYHLFVTQKGMTIHCLPHFIANI